MYYEDLGKHKTPHFHAEYGEYKASFTLDGDLIVGDFPKKQRKLVAGWAVLHENELNIAWEKAINGIGGELAKIAPLA
jgi:hypothetical protein